MLSEMHDMVSRMVLGTATLAAESGAVGKAWLGLAWLGLVWESGREVTALNSLPAMVGLGGCLKSFPAVNLLKKETVFHTGKKNAGPPATYDGGPADWQCGPQDKGPNVL